jgi:hypothetical protein
VMLSSAPSTPRVNGPMSDRHRRALGTGDRGPWGSHMILSRAVARCRGPHRAARVPAYGRDAPVLSRRQWMGRGLHRCVAISR